MGEEKETGVRIAIRVNGQERLWGIDKSRRYYNSLVEKGDNVTEEEKRERHWLWCVLEYWPDRVYDKNVEWDLEKQHLRHEDTRDKFPDEGKYDSNGVPNWI